MQNSYSFNNFHTSTTDSSFFNPQARRSSLGNIGIQSSQLNEFSSPFMPLTPPTSGLLTPASQFSPQFNFNETNQENSSNLFQFIQLQQQVRQMNDQDRLANYLNQQQQQSTSQTLRYLASQQNEPRRNSVCVSTLRPVRESRPSSPIFFQNLSNRELIQQKIDQARDLNNNPTLKNYMPRKFSFDSNMQNTSAFKGLRHRNVSSGGSTGSFSDSLGSINRLDTNDERLAKTGSIFQRREDWSIISKLPINKQNTIHIRLEDEGPYGNDETRCFVLSHFSSLGVKEMACIFCSCELIVYDRFPLIDGTLFISPFQYPDKNGVQAQISTRNQFIYAICLKCMSGQCKQNKIDCKSCHQKWSTGQSLQIGTLYKYDIFAAEPCCKMRVTCKQCKKPLLDLKNGTGGLPYFSTYSERRECENCKAKDYHFIKPLDEIYVKPACMPTKKSDDLKNNSDK